MTENISAFWQHQDPSRPFNLLMAGESFCDRTYEIRRKGENLLSFEYIVSGRGTLRINGQELHPKKHDVYLLTKNSDHHYWSDAEMPWVKIWAVFNGPLADALFDLYLVPDRFLVENCNLLPHLQEILRLAAAPGLPYEVMADKASEVVLRACMEIRSHQAHQPLRLNDQMRQWLDAHVEAPVTLKQMGAHFGYSRNRLIQLFRESFGTTPHQYLQKRRMEAARMYLDHTQMSIAEIAGRLAFADARYFSGCFRAETGLPPLRYRRRRQGETV